MSLPKSFTMKDRTSDVRVKVSYIGADEYSLEYPSGEDQYHKDYVNYLLQHYYDIEESVPPRYPDTLSFTHDYTSQMYDLVKLPHHDLRGCTHHGDTFGVGVTGATYTAEEIAEHFAKGRWRETSFAEENAPMLDWRVHNGPVEEICEVRVNGVTVEKGRELVLPFTFYVEHGTKILYEASHELDSRVYILWEGCEEGTTYSVESVKNFIKNGTWLVQSVGPQKAPEAPTSASKGFTLSVDSEQLALATERANALAQAVENVNIALESFQAIIKDFNVNVEVV